MHVIWALPSVTRLGWALVGCCFLLLQACTLCEDSEKTLAPFRATSRPYKIKGIWYYPQQHYEYEDIGIASWYGERDGTHGHPQATGVIYNMFKDTAAHKTLPIPCMACVTNMENGRSLIVKVSDRGPFKYNRIMDLSVAAAKKLGFYQKGTTIVHIKTLAHESFCLPENQRAYAREAEKRKRKKGCTVISPSLQKPSIVQTSLPSLDSLCEDPCERSLDALLTQAE